MKRILLILFVSLAIFARAQTTYTVINSPDPLTYTAITNACAPNGTTIHSTFNGIFYVDCMDLAIPSINDISSFGFAYTSTLLTNPANGTLTVYLSNTSDALYSKGASWTTAIGGMTQVYQGILNIPTGTVEVNIDFPLPTIFNYTGNCLYVAYSYTGSVFETDPGISAYNKATYHPTNSLGVIGDSFFFNDLENMNSVPSRPVFRFGLVNPSTSLIESGLEKSIQIFPNPCSENLKIINGTGEAIRFELFDVQGRNLWSKSLQGENLQIQLNDLRPGIYFSEIRVGHEVLRKKIIVE